MDVTAGGAMTTQVMVVDDDPEVCRLLRAALEMEGYGVTTAADGGEALARIADEHPALVLLDLHLPVLDGWEVLRRLRTLPLHPAVVFMTAAEQAREQASRHAADGCLPKPFDVARVLDLAERFVPDPVS